MVVYKRKGSRALASLHVIEPAVHNADVSSASIHSRSVSISRRASIHSSAAHTDQPTWPIHMQAIGSCWLHGDVWLALVSHVRVLLIYHTMS